MRGGGEQNEDVPHFVKTEDAGFEVEDLGDVHHRAECIDHAADDEPGQHPGGQCCQHLSCRADAHPAHDDVDTCVQPTRRTDIKHLDDDPNDRQRPDDAQHAPLPKASEGVHAERCIGSCDQKIDRGVIHFAENFQHFIFDLHHVVRGACRK